MIDRLFKGKNYTKFVVVARPRTGSNMLLNSLRTHPNVQVFGEILRGGADTATKEAVKRSAKNYFEENIFKRYAESIRAVGFKIFYQHPVWDQTGTVWPCLQAMRDLRVVHLKRQNLLRILVSAKIARKTDIWKQSGAEQETDKRITLTAEECMEFFQKAVNQEKETDERFAGHPVLQLTYEDLTSQYHLQMKLVQEFLGVKPLQLPQKTIKQNPEPLSELVVNYEELKQALSGTQWEAFLTCPPWVQSLTCCEKSTPT